LPSLAASLGSVFVVAIQLPLLDYLLLGCIFSNCKGIVNLWRRLGIGMKNPKFAAIR
jgi:hypothetical protein